MALQHLRSSTANKRPLPAGMSDGQLAINTNLASPGLFFKDSNGDLVKVGPVHVGTTAPNASPASGGETGNTTGEQWLDTSGTNPVFKIWDGSAWQSEAGEFVNTSGDTMTGALGIIAGSAASPSLFISGDTNTGIYSPGADQVAISTNGTERLFIDSSGNVGVGSSPTSLFSIRGNTPVINIDDELNTSSKIAFRPAILSYTDRGGLSINYSSGEQRLFTGASGAGYFQTFYTDGSERMRITSDGKLGLGTSTPGHQLEIIKNQNAETLVQIGNGDAGSNAVAGFRAIGNSSKYADFRISPSFSLAQLNGGNGIVSLYYDFDTHVWRNNASTERARIDSSGRLLVGTSSARSNFDGNTATPLFQIEGVTAATSSASIVRGANDAIGSTLNLGKTRGAAVGGNTVVSSGDQIGIVSFQAADGTNLIDAASIQAAVDGTPGADDMPGRLVFSTTADGASTPTERMRITSGGKLYVNTTDTTTQDALLNLKNSVDNDWLISCYKTEKGNVVQFLADTPSVQVGKITVSTTSTSYNTSSDYRLKENVVPLTGAADRLKLIPVHRFNFIADPDTTVDGFIAHEAQAVVPECVTGTKDEVDADGNPVYQGIDQSKLVPLLTAALQEALAKIEVLEQRLTDAGIT